jgi:hypothetical protein
VAAGPAGLARERSDVIKSVSPQQQLPRVADLGAHPRTHRGTRRAEPRAQHPVDDGEPPAPVRLLPHPLDHLVRERSEHVGPVHVDAGQLPSRHPEQHPRAQRAELQLDARLGAVVRYQGWRGVQAADQGAVAARGLPRINMPGDHERVIQREDHGEVRRGQPPVPINTGATQKNGPTPLRDALNAPPIKDHDPLEEINANDSRMNQVVDVNGILYGGVNTTVTPATGRLRVGIAFFAVGAVGDGGFLFAHILNQGYVAVDGQNVLFPSIAVDPRGAGAMAFTLSGPRFFPSAAYVRFDFGRPVGPIHISGAGVLPEDGFSGYKAFGSPTPGVARWGDYSAAVAADGAIWMGNEFIPGTPRTVNANWGTFITRLPT